MSGGVIYSLLRKGRLGFASAHQLRRAWLVVVATIGGGVAEFIPGTWALRFASSLVPVVAAIALALFALGNRQLRGMLWVAAGVALNAVAILGNRFMPVSPPQATDHGQVVLLDGVHQLAINPAWAWLGDVMRFPATGQLLSIGDILLLIGIARMTFALTQPPSRGPAAGKSKRGIAVKNQHRADRATTLL